MMSESLRMCTPFTLVLITDGLRACLQSDQQMEVLNESAARVCACA